MTSPNPNEVITYNVILYNKKGREQQNKTITKTLKTRKIDSTIIPHHRLLRY